MASQDLHNQIDERVAFDTQLINSDTTTNGNIIDTQGYESVEFIMQAGVVTTGNVNPILVEGDDSGLSDVGTVSAANTLGSLVELDTTNDITRFGYVGKKRYVRVNVLSAGSTASLTVGVTVILSNPRSAPVAQ